MSFLFSLFFSDVDDVLESLLQLHRKQVEINYKMIKEFRMHEFNISSRDERNVMKGTRNKVQGTRDKGQGTSYEVRGTK